MLLTKYYYENGWEHKLHLEMLTNVENFLNLQIQLLHYTGHGGTCCVFVSDDPDYANQVIKVCIKNESMLKTSDTFLNFCTMLSDNHIKILKPNKILYENEYFFIYTQNICFPIYELNHLSVVKILTIIKNTFN